MASLVSKASKFSKVSRMSHASRAQSRVNGSIHSEVSVMSKKVPVIKELSPKNQKRELKKKEQEFLERAKAYQTINYLTKKTKFDQEQV